MPLFLSQHLPFSLILCSVQSVRAVMGWVVKKSRSCAFHCICGCCLGLCIDFTPPCFFSWGKPTTSPQCRKKKHNFSSWLCSSSICDMTPISLHLCHMWCSCSRTAAEKGLVVPLEPAHVTSPDPLLAHFANGSLQEYSPMHNLISSIHLSYWITACLAFFS